jgi:hypothetical protein
VFGVSAPRLGFSVRSSSAEGAVGHKRIMYSITSSIKILLEIFPILVIYGFPGGGEFRKGYFMVWFGVCI